MYSETLFEARLLTLLDASLDWVYNSCLSLLTVNRPMHLRDRKLKTCKLVCMQTMGSVGSEDTDGITFHRYHQRTEFILLSHI